MLNKLTRYIIIVWSIIFLSLCVTWVVLSYISHNKTYLGKLAVSNISFAESNVNLDNIKYLYTFKIIFPSNIFRYQRNISDIKISSLRLDNIECQYDNNTNTFTYTKSNSLDICNGITISKLQRYIDISTKQIIDKQTTGEVSYSVQFSFRALVIIAIGYIVGIVFIVALRFNNSQNSFYIVDSTNKNPNIIGNSYPSPIKSFVVVLLIAICSMFLCYMLIDSGHDWGGDFSAYINQALSIMNGNVEAYKLENAFIIDNTHKYTNALYGPPTYPWGLSVMLIPFLHVFGLNFLWLKLLMIFHIGILLFSLYYFLMGRLPYFTLCVIVIFFACNYNILIYTNYVISDLTFMAWCMVSIALLDSFLCHFHKLNCYSSANHIDVINKQISSSSLFKNDLFWFVLKGLLAGFAMFIAMSIRTNGIILPISLFCYYISYFFKTRFTSSKLNFILGKNKVNFNSSNSKHFKAKSQLLQSMPKSTPPPPLVRVLKSKLILLYGILLLPIFTCVLLQILLSLWLDFGNGGNLEFLRFDIIYNVKMLFQYIRTFAQIFGDTRIVIGIISIPFVVAGIIRLWDREALCLIFLAGYLGVYMLWVDIGFRAMLPVIPFYIYFFVVGGYILKLGRILNILLICLIVYNIVIDIRQIMHNIPKTCDYASTSKDSMDIYEYVRNHTKQSDVIIFIKPRVLHLFTNRLSFSSFSLSKDALKKAQYIIFAKDFDYFPLNEYSLFSIKNNNYSEVVNNIKELEFQYANNSFIIFKINHSAL